MNNDQLTFFYSKVSFSGLLSLYAMKLSYEKRMGFDKNDMTNNLHLLSEQYFFGFIVACTALKILSFNSKGTVVTTIEMDPLLLARIEQEMEKKISTNSGWKDELELLKKYFN